MIPELAFTLSCLLSCPETKIINDSGEWTQRDQQSLETASRRCGEIYPGSPCLKVFKKVEDGVYSAICGEGK